MISEFFFVGVDQTGVFRYHNACSLSYRLFLLLGLITTRHDLEYLSHATDIGPVGTSIYFNELINSRVRLHVYRVTFIRQLSTF